MSWPSGRSVGAGGDHDDGEGGAAEAASPRRSSRRPAASAPEVAAEAAGLPDAGEVVEEPEEREPDGGEHREPTAGERLDVDVGAQRVDRR